VECLRFWKWIYNVQGEVGSLTARGGSARFLFIFLASIAGGHIRALRLPR